MGCCGTVVWLFILLIIIGSCSAAVNNKKVSKSSSDSLKAETESSEQPEEKPTETIASQPIQGTEIANSSKDEIVNESIIESSTESIVTQVDRESDINARISLIKIVLDDNFKDCYTVNYKTDSGFNEVVVSVWQNGLAAGAYLASEDIGDYKDQWKDMKKSVDYVAKSLYDCLKGIEDVHLSFNVLNDENRDNVLLTYIDGVCIYDVAT